MFNTNIFDDFLNQFQINCGFRPNGESLMQGFAFFEKSLK